GAVLLRELPRVVGALEVVRIRITLRAQRFQLLAPFCDHLVRVEQGSVRFVHGHSPCLRLAVMKSSRSPSSTDVVLSISILVRRSLISDWSSTYERIWWPQPMSVLLSSSACFSSFLLRSSSSYSRDFRSDIASARLRCCERSF